jgi:hypothetical protein
MNQRHRRLLAVCFSLGCATAPRLARAGESRSDNEVNGRPRRFGEAGELAIDAATEMNLERADASPSSVFPPLSRVFIESAVDLFVVRGLSLGARVSYEHLAQRGFPSADFLSAGPRVGYNVSIDDHWSFWPAVYGVYEAVWDGGASAPTLSLGAYAPVLFHPAPHLFFGLGPYVTTTLAAIGARGTPGDENVYGLSLTLGGWLET